MATHMHGSASPRRPPAPVTACDGCGLPNQASWLTLFGLAAYCRDCAGAAAATHQRTAEAAYAGDEGAKAEREMHVADRLTSPRPYTRSAEIVREHFGLG